MEPFARPLREPVRFHTDDIYRSLWFRLGPRRSAFSGCVAMSDPQATQKRSECQHHWVIDPPAGPASKVMCRSCGEKCDFSNYNEGSAWHPSLPAEYQIEIVEKTLAGLLPHAREETRE